MSRVFALPGCGARAISAICTSAFTRRVSIAAGQVVGVCAAPIVEAQPPHQQDRPPEPVVVPSPAGCDDDARKTERRRNRLQGLRQRDVLHERKIGITAYAAEGGVDKDGLVAGGDARQPRAKIHQGGDERQQNVATGDLHIETGPRRVRSVQALRARAPTPVRQNGVGVQEQENVARRSRAPAFIWAARARCATIARSASGPVSARVASLLPPSTTIVSQPAARNGARRSRLATIPATSFRTGRTIETFAAKAIFPFRGLWRRPIRSGAPVLGGTIPAGDVGTRSPQEFYPCSVRS